MTLKLGLLVVCLSGWLMGQTPPPAGNAPQSKDAMEPGIPVRNALVKQKCGTCHRDDGKGNLTRISWERSTPEGWEQIIKRMIRLNGLTLKPEEAKEILKYLADEHGLAPEEAKPVVWYAEKRQIVKEEFPETPEFPLRETCAACHPIAIPNSFRRSKEEWTLLAAMHRGYFPVVEFTAFRSRPGGGGRGRAGAGAAAQPEAQGPPPKEPFEHAIEFLSKTNPLQTPEWSAWQASRKSPKIEGKWLVAASASGKGKYTGELTIQSVGPDEFKTTAKLTSLSGAETITREGKGIVYAGYAWRGKSKSANGSEREVLTFSRDQLRAEGRWFWGGYQEFGFDVKLQRADEMPSLLTTDIDSLKTGTQGATVKIYGDHLPTALTAADVDFGNGVKTVSLTKHTASVIEAKVDVDAGAVLGYRDVAVKRLTLPKAIAVYDKIDYIKTPEAALAHLGGTTHPKGFYQFEAIAWNRGLDNKPNTADDVPLGPVKAKWSLEEFYSHYGDDDKEFIGSLSAEGLFTPSLEGPNSKRKFSADNYGDVWVVATYTPPGAGSGVEALSARTYLVVAVPQYVRWDQPEVAE